MDLLFEKETFSIRGAVFEVYKELGVGFLESVYQECLEKEFAIRAIPYQRQVELRINYKGEELDQFFKADIICYESILIELKAVKSIEPIHKAQVLNYLKASGLRLGLLINFNSFPKVAIERIIL